MKFKSFVTEEEEADVSTAREKWVATGADVDSVNNYLHTFRALKAKHIIKPPHSDLAYWIGKPFDKFKEHIDAGNNKVKEHETKTESKGDWKELFKNDKVSVKMPKTFEASCSLARGRSHWCTASSNKKDYWNRYIHILGFTPYYVFYKDKKDTDPNSKFAVSVNHDGSVKNVWTQDNNKLESSQGKELINSLGIPDRILIPRVKHNDAFEGELLKDAPEMHDHAHNVLVAMFNELGKTRYDKAKDKDFKLDEWKDNYLMKKIRQSVSTISPELENWIKTTYVDRLIWGRKYLWKE